MKMEPLIESLKRTSKSYNPFTNKIINISKTRSFKHYILKPTNSTPSQNETPQTSSSYVEEITYDPSIYTPKNPF